MTTNTHTIYTLREQRIMCLESMEVYEKRIRNLKLEIASLDEEIGVLNGKPKRGFTTKLIAVHLDHAGARGITADDIVNVAATKWKCVNRKTVVTILGRMKSAGIVSLVNGRYVKNQTNN